MSALSEIRDYIDDLGLATAGEDLFIEYFDPGKKVGILLRNFGGDIDPYVRGGNMVLKFQATIRGETYSSAENKAEELIENLTLRRKQLGDILFFRVDPDHNPLPSGREAGGVHTFVVNFTANWQKRES